MATEIEHFNLSLPRDLAAKGLCDGNRREVPRAATVRRADRFLKLADTIRVRHR